MEKPILKISRVIAVFLVVFALFSQSIIARSSSQSITETPIKHVIYIMMENHSFDNFFGNYPLGDTNSSNSDIEKPLNLLDNTSDVPTLTQLPAGTVNTSDPHESVYPEDYANGTNSGFLQYSGPQAMTYFTNAQIPVEWDWAIDYGLGDNYFSTVLSETTPNRLMSVAGYTPIMSDEGPPPYVPFNATIFYQLSERGISWGAYNTYDDDYPMDFYSGITNYSSNFHSLNDLYETLEGPNLPSLVYVNSLESQSEDQHPSGNVTQGETWLLGIVNHIMASPYWNSTVIFINYDEGGGYYDQVPPPQLDGYQLGFRVPLIVISPYSKENYVSNTELNHLSILAFIEYNWNLPPLNSLVAASKIPIDFFDWSVVRPPVMFENYSAFPVSPQIAFDSLPYARNGSSDLSLGASSSETASSSQSTSAQPGTTTSSLVVATPSGSTSSATMISPAYLLVISVAVSVMASLVLIRKRIGG